jgi:signal transduction histidine kinase/DNA-binding NarL/FixJ family response regulator
MTNDNDFIRIIDDGTPQTAAPTAVWKVAIIDDDEAVHEGTRFALYDYNLNGQGIEIISAHSAEAGRALMRANPDIAVVLLDVVMETDDAGLRLVDFIRNDLQNDTVRIILRTGQPGQAPERRVIVDYDINDYKAKTELTADKLFTALSAALRGYQQLQRMVATRRGLEMIIEGASTLFDFKSMQRLAEGVLTQLATLINADCGGILVLRDGVSAADKFSILAGSGCYRRFANTTDPAALDPVLRGAVDETFQRQAHTFQPKLSTLYIRTGSGREVVVLLETQRPLSATDRSLVEVFCSRLSVAFDNVILYEQLNDATVRLEERVRERTRALTAANHRLTSQWIRLRRANAFKNEVLGTIAHDLKNPLAVILGRAEMLNELAEMSPTPLSKIREQLGHIRSSATQLTGMVNDLVADAMMDALDISLRQERVDVAAILTDVVTANRGLAERKRQTIHLATPPVNWLHCDPDRLREAVDNLLSNAVKYSPNGGKIELTMTVDEAFTHIVVRDEGAGLSQEDLGRLFGRFQRLSAKPTGGESSTGLGLSIVKHIVELHGGTISADSAGPGHGSTFTIRLPKVTEATS